MFNIIFYKPLLNALVLLVNYLPFHSVGLAVVVLTVIVRLIISPFSHKSSMAQIKMKKIEPEIKNIKEKFKDDKQEQAKRTMELYKQHGINPFASFVVLLIQLPIIFALYKVFLGGVNFDPSGFYSFVRLPSVIDINFLGFIDVTKPNVFLAILAGITQFIQISLMSPSLPKSEDKGKSDFQSQLMRSMGWQMKFMMPLLIFYISLKFSAVIAIYLTTMNVFAIIHEFIVKKQAEKTYGNTN